MAMCCKSHFRNPLRGVGSAVGVLKGGFTPAYSAHGPGIERRWSAVIQGRCYSNMAGGWSFNKVQYTKYRITKPWTPDTQFDDILLSLPSREHFARFTKETPLFLRFLKLVTDVEGRPQDFIDFAKRCESGLNVEKDVFISKEELMKCIWENGFSQNEMNAFEFAFPLDYKFHYPELAVLFQLSEEDCYKYCIRQRAKTPGKLVEIKYEQPKNLLSSYGLCFLGVWFGFSNQVFNNAWFYSKTFPFGAVFYMLASYFYRNIREYVWKEEKSLVLSAKQRKDSGEELVYRQMKKYTSDARCLDYLSSFKGEVQHQLAEYHAAITEQLRLRLHQRMSAKLTAIQQAEKIMEGSLQEVIVREIIASFRGKFSSSLKLQDAAFVAAVQSISGEMPSVDPVGAHFIASLKELGCADLENSIPKVDGSVVERVVAEFQRREQEFLESFTVSPEEATEVQMIVHKCKSGNDYDFSKLSLNEAKRLDDLQETINNRFGFSTITEDDIMPLNSVARSQLVEQVNTKIAIAKAGIRTARLSSFARAFA